MKIHAANAPRSKYSFQSSSSVSMTGNLPFCRRNSLGRWIFEIGNQQCYWCLRRQKPLSCLNLMLLEADLNLHVLKGGNLLMFYAPLPLLLTVPLLDVGFSGKWCEPEESEFGCFISTGRWSRKMLVKFYGTPFRSCRVNLRLECSLVAIFLPFLRLRLTFINPNKHFAAILQRMLL